MHILHIGRRANYFPNPLPQFTLRVCVRGTHYSVSHQHLVLAGFFSVLSLSPSLLCLLPPSSTLSLPFSLLPSLHSSFTSFHILVSVTTYMTVVLTCLSLIPNDVELAFWVLFCKMPV